MEKGGGRVAATNNSGHYVIGKTRGGNQVRIYSDEAGGDFPVHGSWWYEAEERWIPAAWTMEGYCQSKDTPRSLDLNLKTLKF